MNDIPPCDSFTLVLSKILNGEPELISPFISFEYQWNFNTGTGSGKMKSINGNDFVYPLFPVGCSEILGFISDFEPQKLIINGQEILLNRVFMGVYYKNEEKVAMIMTMNNESNTATIVTENWRSDLNNIF